MAGRKILIVEDEGILALNLKMILSELGHEVLGISPTGEEGIRLAQDLCPDLVIMDIRLAGDIDGIEAATRIRQYSNTPIMFLTAHSDSSTYHRAMTVKPVGFLKKPVEDSVWSNLIEEALQKN